MFPEQLKKVLELVKKTGDKVVVLDSSSPDDSYVIMSLDNYSALANVAPSKAVQNIVEKVAPIIANLPVAETEKTAINLNISSVSEETENLTDEDLTDKINREISMWKNRDDSVYLGEENKPKKVWQIPTKVKDKAQEIE